MSQLMLAGGDVNAYWYTHPALQWGYRVALGPLLDGLRKACLPLAPWPVIGGFVGNHSELSNVPARSSVSDRQSYPLSMTSVGVL